MFLCTLCAAVGWCNKRLHRPELHGMDNFKKLINKNNETLVCTKWKELFDQP
jgi:hypothetical protein